MRRLKKLVVTIAVIIAGCSTGTSPEEKGGTMAEAAPSTADGRGFAAGQKAALEAFVGEAVKLMEREGEKAFPPFRKKGGRWFQGDRYIFVWEMDGVRVVYPPNPSGEGKNMLDLKDPDGLPIGRLFIKAVSGPRGEGWVHYRWPEPGGGSPLPKSTFMKQVTIPGGKKYLVGSGLYLQG